MVVILLSAVALACALRDVPSGRPAAAPRAAASRRLFLAAAATPLLVGTALPRPALAAGRPRVEVLSTPSVCQGRCKDQDFVVVKYVGRRADGKVFDDRYASKPLTYELGQFYLPGVDDVLEGACVGSRFKFTWPSSPSLGAEFETVLPAQTPIIVELELASIRYSLFGEKMRNASSTYWFSSEPLTLTSTPDYERGFASPRVPEIKKDNPFSVAPGEKSLISNPASAVDGLVPLINGFPKLGGDGTGLSIFGDKK